MSQEKAGALGRSHSKRDVVPARKQVASDLLGTKGGLSGPRSVPRPQKIVLSNRQHYSHCLHKQGRGYEVGPTVPFCGES